MINVEKRPSYSALYNAYLDECRRTRSMRVLLEELERRHRAEIADLQAAHAEALATARSAA